MRERLDPLRYGKVVSNPALALWLLSASASHAPATSLDEVADRIVERIETGWTSTWGDSPAAQEEHELEPLCAQGAEMACQLRWIDVPDRADALGWHASSPCDASLPCAPAWVLVPRAADPTGHTEGFSWKIDERTWDGRTEIVALSQEGVVGHVDASVLDLHPNVPVLPNRREEVAYCGGDGVVWVLRERDEVRTGIDCGRFRWGPGDERLWVHARGHLVALDLADGRVHSWVVSGGRQLSLAGVDAREVPWFSTGLGGGVLLAADVAVPLQEAPAAPGLAGMWRRGRDLLWVAPELAVRHDRLVVADGSLIVLDDDAMIVWDYGAEPWIRVESGAVPLELRSARGPVRTDLLDLASVVVSVPAGIRWRSLVVWSAGIGPHAVGVDHSRMRSRRRCASSSSCASLGFEMRASRQDGFATGWEAKGTLRSYADGSWLLSGRVCSIVGEGWTPVDCPPIEIEWRASP